MYLKKVRRLNLDAPATKVNPARAADAHQQKYRNAKDKITLPKVSLLEKTPKND